MMNGRDTMMIELIRLTGTDGGYELLDAYEEALYALGGRPHWGQVNTLSGGHDTLRRLYPRYDRLARRPRPARPGRRLRLAVREARRDQRLTRASQRFTKRRRRRSVPMPASELAAQARLLGADTQVPCVDGRMRRYVNLDYAASTPALAEVWAAVEAFMPWYSSVHRGSGVKSQVATEAFEGARDVVARVRRRARRATTVVFVRNTTEAINVLAAALPAGTRVLSQPGRAPREHAAVAAPRRAAAAVHRLGRRAARRARARAARASRGSTSSQ